MGSTIYVVGGIEQRGGPTKEVQTYDPGEDKWTKGPSIVGKGSMAGFGAAAWSVNGQLVVSTYEGDILCLSEDGARWNLRGTTADSRFFHRLIPVSERELAVVGGANMESGKFRNVELVTID